MNSASFVTRVQKFQKTKKMGILLSIGSFCDQFHNLNIYLFYKNIKSFRITAAQRIR